jgi:E3 ubiquitin-protein ligase BIG BROTHER-like protein
MDQNNNGDDRKQMSTTRQTSTARVYNFDDDQSIPVSDFALALVLQEQERAFSLLSSTESNDSEELDADSDGFYQRREFEAELEFLVDEESDDISEYDDDGDEEMDLDDEIDVDELTYEELIAIGEFIGVEKRGLSLNEISNCLVKPSKSKSINGIDRCVICQVEFEDEELVALVNCNHPYHSDCISKWLLVKKSCPICSTEVSPPPKN